MAPKRCPHCFKKVPLRKRLRAKCPHCFQPFRRRSGLQERSAIGLWLEDRTTTFWFLVLLLLFVIAAMVLQVFGQPDLLNFIDQRTFWFIVTLLYAAMMLSIVGRIYFPLLLGAPRILRRERSVIRQYRNLTTAGLIIGIPFAILIVGVHDVWSRLPGTIFLITIPMALLWAYQALTLTEEEYEDERVWSYLQELGAQDRLEHRHHAYFVLFAIPLSTLLFFYFLNHPIIAHAIMRSQESGLLAMLRDAWHRTAVH
jgi:hypothetical protein